MSGDAGKALCEAWGLDPHRVGRITVDLGPTSNSVEVVWIDADNRAATHLGKYQLVEKDTIARLTAEVERLRAAGDALSRALGEWLAEHRHPASDDAAIAVWLEVRA